MPSKYDEGYYDNPTQYPVFPGYKTDYPEIFGPDYSEKYEIGKKFWDPEKKKIRRFRGTQKKLRAGHHGLFDSTYEEEPVWGYSEPQQADYSEEYLQQQQQNQTGQQAGSKATGEAEAGTIQTPEYVRPEQVELGEEPPEFEAPEAGEDFKEPEFYGLSSGDFQDVENQIYGEQMSAVRSEFGRRGTGPSGAYTTAAMRAKRGASKAARELKQQEMQRRTQWEQDEALREWQEREGQYAHDLQQWQAERQAKEREAENRRNWLWQTYQLPRQEMWQEMSQAMQQVQIPFSTVPYQSWNAQTFG